MPGTFMDHRRELWGDKQSRGIGTRLLTVLFALPCLFAGTVVLAAAFSGGRFVEPDGWKARINVDCLLKDKQCGSFRYETLGCEGDLVYAGEADGMFEFHAELRAGKCLPGCTLQVSSDFKRYVEICQSDRHEGKLAPEVVLSAPKVVEVAAPPAAPATQSAPAAAAQPATPEPPFRTDRTGNATYKGNYVLDAKTGQVTGKVRIDWDNGDSFDGRLTNGQRNGRGKFSWANGQVYDGDWKNDQADGHALIVFPNGDRYEGQVRGGVPNGRGEKKLANGDRYEGGYANGLPDGDGVYAEKTGARYSGQWKAGARSGKGKFVWASGQSYEGEWVADKPEGMGVLVYSNGDRYEGPVSNGLPHGKGVKTFAATQDRFEGIFVQGDIQGEGSYHWKNGDLYAGGWSHGKQNGQGRYTWANGDYWEGEFADDHQTQNGRLYFKTTLDASGGDFEKVVKQTNNVADTGASKTGAAAQVKVDRNRLLGIPMVTKEVKDCARRGETGCAERVIDDVINDRLFQHKWQTMSSEKDAKGKTTIFDVDTNSQLENGNVFSWLRSGDTSNARNIGIKYDCRGQSLEIQLIYTCSGSQLQNCTLDPSVEKYAGKVIPATDIKNWFKGACDRP